MDIYSLQLFHVFSEEMYSTRHISAVFLRILLVGKDISPVLFVKENPEGI